MTEQQKIMKRYCSQVERRLNLPREVKVRIMADFCTTIAGLREQGLSDQDIFDRLGSPKAAAADLNEQMKEFAYRKSPWRFAGLGAAWISGLLLAFTAGMNLIAGLLAGIRGDAWSTGIIGGSDGPTAVFVTTRAGINPDFVILLGTLVLGLLTWWRLSRCKPRGK